MIKYQYWAIGVLVIVLLVRVKTKDTTKDYTPILSTQKILRQETAIIKEITQKKLQTEEAFAREFPTLKEYLEKQKELSNKFALVGNDIETIENIIRPLIYDEEYNIKRPTRRVYFKRNALVKKILKKENPTEKISVQWQELKEKIEAITNAPKLLKTNAQPTLRHQIDSVLGTIQFLNYLKSEEKLAKAIQETDMINAWLFITALEHELVFLEHAIIYTLSSFVVGEVHNFLAEQQRTISIVPLEKEKNGIHANIELVKIIDKNIVGMEIDGDSIPVKEGIGSLSFTPSKIGEHRFHATIITKNPYTNRSSVYKKSIKLQVN